MDKWLYRASIAVVTIGLLVSIYMTIFKITDNASMCLGSHACSDVIHSRYSQVTDFLSVPTFGIIGFAVLMALLILEPKIPFLTQNGSMIIFGIALIGFLFTVWLIYVEIALIKALCPFCVTTQTMMVLTFVLSIVRLNQHPQS